MRCSKLLLCQFLLLLLTFHLTFLTPKVGTQRICFGYREPRPYRTEELMQRPERGDYYHPEQDDNQHHQNHHQTESSDSHSSGEQPQNLWATIRRNLHL